MEMDENGVMSSEELEMDENGVKSSGELFQVLFQLEKQNKYLSIGGIIIVVVIVLIIVIALFPKCHTTESWTV